MNSTIYTIGDSHGHAAWPAYVKRYYLGPSLCYSFGVDKLKRCDIRLIDLKDNDIIIFCLGEIDCRCHIHKYVQDSSYQFIIDNIVNSYFETIQLIINVSNIKLKEICVYNVVPPVKKSTIQDNPLFPCLGTDEERKEYVLYFNKKLKEKCIEYNYLFFDVYDKYIDSEGFLDKPSSDGNVHISNSIHIENFIKEYLT